MADCIPYRETRYFSDLICDYLEEKKSLQSFYHRFSRLENFKKQLLEKQQNYPLEHRHVLVTSLKKQYENVPAPKTVSDQIDLLAKDNTFTVTTGHQLNLFTGPLYFLYKIVSAINLAKQLQNKYPNYNFVPVYWMAGEDHDFEEINFFNFNGEKVRWNKKASGAVGELSTEGMESVLNDFSKKLPSSENGEFLRKLFKKAYLEHKSFSEATFYIANELFGEYGLVCLDANKRELKKLFAPQIKKELIEQPAFENTAKSIKTLENLGYKIQVNPREINLFYLEKGVRERIVKREKEYLVNETELVFSEKEILELAETKPEKFSPNVVMRPLYQEVILPNLCYIGGGGELAYWLELKNYFEKEKLPFPVLLLRNSALLISEKQEKKLNKLGVSTEDLFLPQSELKTQHTKRISEIAIDFSPQKKHLQQQFEALYDLAKKTDKSFLGAVAAQEKKQTNGLEHLEKRLLKAQKRKLEDELKRLTSLQDQLFPKHGLQERHDNFSSFYLEYGKSLIPKLLRELDPLKLEFMVLRF